MHRVGKRNEDAGKHKRYSYFQHSILLPRYNCGLLVSWRRVSPQGGLTGHDGGSLSSGKGGTGGNGGNSFDAGTDQILNPDFRTGNGEVIITELAAEVQPASIALIAAGLVGFITLRRRRR